MVQLQFKQSYTSLRLFQEQREQLLSFLNRIAPADYTLLEVAVHEAINNIFIYSNPDVVYLSIRLNKKNKIIIRVKDSGEGFQPEKFLHKALSSIHNDQLLNASGRGIFIMYSLSDFMLYNRQGNDVIMVKQLK